MILSALNDYYDRLLQREQVSPFGYSMESISYAIVIGESGQVVSIDDIRNVSGNKPIPQSMQVPASFKRPGTKPSSFFLWDNSAYVLGVKRDSKTKELIFTEKNHAAFTALHMKRLSACNDVAIKAFLEFLRQWRPERFDENYFSEGMLNTNFVFRMDGQRRFLQEILEARKVYEEMLNELSSRKGTCLVSGMTAPIARLHPSIKGFESTGSSIVSFNLDAFGSYGKSQGENAPVSEQVAFAYTTVLNHLLRRNERNRQRLKIGDATVVFWAVADSPDKATTAELTFANMLEPPIDDAQEAAKLRSLLDAVAKGRPMQEIDANLDPATRIYVLGLAPNASRLSVRFWEMGSLEMFAGRLAEHYQDLRLEPLPWKGEPTIWRLLYATAPSRDGKAKTEDIPPQLAGEMTRAILTGRRYPRSLLANTAMRFRADGDISGVRIALCKAVLTRDMRLGVKGIEEEIPMSLDRESTSPAYRLGRLFAELENVQRTALGSVNASIKDRFFGAASATPASVFPILLRNAQHHLSRLKKDKPGLAHVLEKEISEIIDGLEAWFPRSLRIEEQGRFAIAYYHQANARFASKATQTENETESELEGVTK